MKLRLTDLTGRALVLDLDYLAGTFGLRGLESARVIYTTTEEFLTELGTDDGVDLDDVELGGEG